MINKTCSICDIEQPIDQFHKKRNSHTHRCKTCEKSYQQTYYVANRKKRIATAKKHSAKKMNEIKQYVVDYLIQNPCVDCGQTNILTLQFDHRQDKKFTISIIASSARPISIEKLKTEINKCDVRCANCHQIKTAYASNWWKLKYIPSSCSHIPSV